MRVALINPGVPASLKKENLGAAYLAATLEAAGHSVVIIDEVAGQEVEAGLAAFGPDVAGIGCMTMTAPRAYSLADRIRAAGLPVILGGAHPTALPEEALAHADCVVRGEGELTLPELLASGHIEGIVEARPPEDLDALPLPSRHLLDLDFYASSGDELAGYSLRTLGIITSRGCPYHCRFCVNSKREAALRFHGPDRVIQELRDLVARYGIESVAFYDELIASDPARFQEVCERMVAEKLDRLKWECQMHPRTVQPESLRRMKRAGCIQVALGFESGSQPILDAIRKNTTVEQNLEAAQRVHEAGLRVRGCFVVGMPGETVEDIRATEAFIQAAQVDFASIHFLTPMPGTELFDAYAEEIRAAGIPWDRFTAGDPDAFACNRTVPAEVQKREFLRLSARQAFRNYPLREMIRRALRDPRRALHVALQRMGRR